MSGQLEWDCGGWINLLSHKVKRRLDAQLADLGITGMQSRVLYHIVKNSAKGSIFQRDVEAAFGLSRSTATGILQMLEKEGLLVRCAVPDDGRLKQLVPTAKAQQMVAQVGAGVRETEARMTAGISPGQLQVFLEVAAKMSENLDACAPLGGRNCG